MTKGEILKLIDRKVKYHLDLADYFNGKNDHNSVAQSNYEYGMAVAFQEARSIIGMLDKPNKISDNG